MDGLFRSHQFIQLVSLAGLALLVSLARWGWLAWRGRGGGVARLSRARFVRPSYTLSDGVGWARLEVRAPPLVTLVIMLVVTMVGLGAIGPPPDRNGATAARTPAELALIGLISALVALYCGSSRVDLRVEAGGGFEARRSGPFGRTTIWTVAEVRDVSIIVAPGGALKVEVQEDDGADGVIADRRFYFAAQFDDDDPPVDKDLAVASETFTAVARDGKRG